MKTVGLSRNFGEDVKTSRDLQKNHFSFVKFPQILNTSLEISGLNFAEI